MTVPLLEQLNIAQRTAAEIVHGPVLVLAGPGSGKTRLLTHRIAYMVSEIGIDPYHILAVTFTNRAAREMRERLHGLAGSSVDGLTMGTFHSICARWLRRDMQHMGRERDFLIYDSDDQLRVMKRVVAELKLDDKRYNPRAILGTISRAKNELVTVEEYARYNRSYYDEIVTRCYQRYQELLTESNALDFDDLLMVMVQVLQQHPAVLAQYHERYRYLLVDEYQDTNRAQYVLVRLLAQHKRNLFVVGDDDQGIYAWRGADIRNILQFEDDYPDAQVVLLEQNYRSTGAILATAQAVMSGSRQRKHAKQLWTQNGDGVKVSLIEGYDQNDEAQRVVEEISRLLHSGEYQAGDCAIMYRTNAQSRVLEEALIARNVRYQIVGGTRFYERREVKDVLAYLRVIANHADSVSLERIINTPPRGIGDKTVATLQREAAERGLSLFGVLQQLQRTDGAAAPLPFAPRTRNALLQFAALIDDLTAARDTHDLPALIDYVTERIELRDALRREYGEDESSDRWANVLELRDVAGDYLGLATGAQLATFLEEVALVSDIDGMANQQDTVTCITLHQAKGLEYPVVFLVGLEEGLLPHSRTLDDPDQIEEERRLLYVGVTRARRLLYLLYAFRRTSFGRTSLSEPSRFLRDIRSFDPDLLEQAARRPVVAVPPATRQRRRGSAGATANAADAPAPQVRFFAGQRVLHRTFGEGVVTQSRVVDDDEEVVVHFEAAGEKRLLASFARLRHLD